MRRAALLATQVKGELRRADRSLINQSEEEWRLSRRGNTLESHAHESIGVGVVETSCLSERDDVLVLRGQAGNGDAVEVVFARYLARTISDGCGVVLVLTLLVVFRCVWAALCWATLWAWDEGIAGASVEVECE